MTSWPRWRIDHQRQGGSGAARYSPSVFGSTALRADGCASRRQVLPNSTERRAGCRRDQFGRVRDRTSTSTDIARFPIRRTQGRADGSAANPGEPFVWLRTIGIRASRHCCSAGCTRSAAGFGRLRRDGAAGRRCACRWLLMPPNDHGDATPVPPTLTDGAAGTGRRPPGQRAESCGPAGSRRALGDRRSSLRWWASQARTTATSRTGRPERAHGPEQASSSPKRAVCRRTESARCSAARFCARRAGAAGLRSSSVVHAGVTACREIDLWWPAAEIAPRAAAASTMLPPPALTTTPCAARLGAGVPWSPAPGSVGQRRAAASHCPTIAAPTASSWRWRRCGDARSRRGDADRRVVAGCADPARHCRRRQHGSR